MTLRFLFPPRFALTPRGREEGSKWGRFPSSSTLLRETWCWNSHLNAPLFSTNIHSRYHYMSDVLGFLASLWMLLQPYIVKSKFWFSIPLNKRMVFFHLQHETSRIMMQGDLCRTWSVEIFQWLCSIYFYGSLETNVFALVFSWNRPEPIMMCTTSLGNDDA